MLITLALGVGRFVTVCSKTKDKFWMMRREVVKNDPKVV
jgi:hypothetical protein